MQARFEELLAAFERSEVGVAVRSVSLAGVSVKEAHKRLVALGFIHHRVRIRAERTAAGAPKWVLLDGTATTDPQNAKLAPIDEYIHVDRSMVRVFPTGDPRGRHVPKTGAFAIKSVLFEVPKPGEAQAGTLFSDEAFRVSDAGASMPKSRRHAYGLNYDPQFQVESYRFAEAFVSGDAVIALAPEAEVSPGAGAFKL